jgi:hypothetical protein
MLAEMLVEFLAVAEADLSDLVPNTVMSSNALSWSSDARFKSGVGAVMGPSVLVRI